MNSKPHPTVVARPASTMASPLTINIFFGERVLLALTSHALRNFLMAASGSERWGILPGDQWHIHYV
jgi:hypothetical protein